jgi:aryl-alcohol dehydrogenase-like predicted oxidoreductase
MPRANEQQGPLATASDDFVHRGVPALGKRVHRLGVALNYGLDAAGVEAAADRGLNYFFVTANKTASARVGLRRLLGQDRERFVVATGPSLGYFGFNVRAGAEKWLRELGTDHLDVFHLFWVGVGSALTDGTLEAMRALKAEGKVRAFGISIHDRPRAARLAVDSPIDLFMLRYNAAHPGAERDVFPHLAARKPAVVAYTATAWRRLLRAPRGWEGAPMTAGDCYRFCLSSPHVDLVLCAPADRAQLDENLEALSRGPLTADEAQWMRRFGQAVHG